MDIPYDPSEAKPSEESEYPWPTGLDKNRVGQIPLAEIFIAERSGNFCMAKKSSKGRRFNLRRVRVTPERALATLASDTAIVNALAANAVSSYRATSVKATWSVIGLTAGEGPITVGLAHDDYSLTEIKECLEAAASIDPGDKIAQEQANRLVRVVGVCSVEAPSLNDGKPISTKLNWLIGVGHSINMFAYNEFTGALTTGAVLNMQGDLWLKDSA